MSSAPGQCCSREKTKLLSLTLTLAVGELGIKMKHWGAAFHGKVWHLRNLTVKSWYKLHLHQLVLATSYNMCCFSKRHGQPCHCLWCNVWSFMVTFLVQVQYILCYACAGSQFQMCAMQQGIPIAHTLGRPLSLAPLGGQIAGHLDCGAGLLGYQGAS